MMKPIVVEELPRNLSECDDRTREILAKITNQTVELTGIELADATMVSLVLTLEESYDELSVRDRRRLVKLYVKAVERLMTLVRREGCPEYSWERPITLEEPMTKPSASTEEKRGWKVPSPKSLANWQAMARDIIWDMNGTLPTNAEIAICVTALITTVLAGEVFSNKSTLQHKLELGKLYLQALSHQTTVTHTRHPSIPDHVLHLN